jgi:regulator of sigma E protease
VAKTGSSETLTFSAFLSLKLFLVNLLPLPALDGGADLYPAGAGAWRATYRPEKEGAVHAIGMLVLLAVMAVVTFYDYQRYFG